MANNLIGQIEAKLDLLIERCNQLESENAVLREKAVQWQDERKRLMDKNEMARSRVEAMISQLKNMEA